MNHLNMKTTHVNVNKHVNENKHANKNKLGGTHVNVHLKRTNKMAVFAASALCACAIATLPACGVLPHQAGSSDAGGNTDPSALSAVTASKAALSYAADAFREKQSAYAADTSTTVLLDGEKVASSDIVKVIKHGDHWHVFTKDGREIITYSDPTRAMQASDLTNTASVVSRAALQHMDVRVVKILKHGDHFHIFTNTGQEFITYADPSSLYPNIPIGTYTGSHGSLHRHAFDDFHQVLDGLAQGGADGEGAGSAPGAAGFVPAQLDGNGAALVPSEFPEALAQALQQKGGPAGQPGYPNSALNGLQNGLPNGSHQNSAPLVGLPFVRVVSLAELAQMPITKILQHADHYHCYTSAGEELITYENPQAAFPHVHIGTYVGSHGSFSHGADSTPNDADSTPTDTPSNSGASTEPSSTPLPVPVPPAPVPAPFTPAPTPVQPAPTPAPAPINPSHNQASEDPAHGSASHLVPDESEVEKILKHGDHWHVYLKNGQECVVYSDPSALYPHIKIGEYLGTHTQPLKPLNADEVFTYESVEARNIVPLDKMPWADCKYMRFFDKEQQTFYVYHLAGARHPHSHPIREIIQFAKSYPADFHGFSARDVVATLKYRVEHPGEWQLSADYESEYHPLANNQAAKRRITHIFKETGDMQGFYVVYYETGRPEALQALPDNTQVKPVNVVAVSRKTYDEIKDDVCKKYRITSDQFDKIKLKLPPCSLQGIRFNDDATFEVHGTRYNIHELIA